MRYLYHLLFNFLLMSGTLFAAGGGISALGGDGGGANGGDGGAGADAGNGAGDGGGADNTLSGDGGDGVDAVDAAQDGAANQNTDGAEDPNAPVDLGDGRQVPGKWKKLFDAAKDQGLDKEVKQLFFSSQRLASKFPGGVNEALKFAEAVEGHGGLDGIAQMKGEMETYSADAQLFQSDPAKWIESNFAANADASLKAFTHSLEFVGEHHPEQYDHLMAKVIVNDLNNLNVHDIYGVLSELKDNPKAQQLAGELAKYYNARRETSQKVPEKKVEPERQKLEADRQKLQSEQETLRNSTVNSQTIPRLGRQMSTQLEKEAKAVGFDLKKFASEQPKAWQALRGDILKAVMVKASSDLTFSRNYRAVLKEGDTARAAEMMNKKHDAILSDIVRDTARGYGILKKGGVRPGADKASARPNSGGNNSAMLRVNGKPPAGEIDWSKTGDKIYDSIAVLKSGKTVTWA